MPKWRNWQTRTTQTRVGNPRVGSSPTFGTFFCPFFFGSSHKFFGSSVLFWELQLNLWLDSWSVSEIATRIYRNDVTELLISLGNCWVTM